MKVFKKIGWLFFIGLLLVVVYLAFNFVTFGSKQITAQSITPIRIDKSAVENFQKAIKIQTVSPENSIDFDSTQFDLFNTFLKESYPMVDSLLEKKVFNSYSFLYQWKGIDPSLKPIILMGHLDVVPVIEANKTDWRREPFGGEIKQDTIWGRGTLDDKVGVISIMEAVELLLKEGFKPDRSIYLSFGHDEELGGEAGAKTIARYLKEQGVRAEFVLDEGGSIVRGLIPGIKKDVALIGIAEKGSVSLDLTVKLEGGHSSMPEKETAIDVLATAIAKVKNNPFPAKITKPMKGFIEQLGPEMTFINKLAFSNQALFEPLIISTYEASTSGNALIRTTTSPTIFNSGVKENIIPLSASATINFRIIPETTVAQVKDRVKNLIADDRIKITLGSFNSEPSKVSNIDSFGYQKIHETIAEIYPDILVSPYLVIAATDSRHFEEVSENIYRFATITINPENIKSIHGLNERIPVQDFENAIRFYVQLIKNGTVKS